MMKMRNKLMEIQKISSFVRKKKAKRQGEVMQDGAPAHRAKSTILVWHQRKTVYLFPGRSVYKGVFPVTATIAFLPIERVLSVNTDS